ncbi:hypothetical protein AB4305_03770 [Nocardia sp. 2YAB30]|uniref:hypothetical protein n=1 Tax=unclassified Nocardia TaxID=2637762 RepID=UPI003F98689F
MTDIDKWNERTQRELAEIRRTGQQLATAAAAIRGRGEVRGITVEVDMQGDITNLQIAPGAMRWSSTQLTAALLDGHRRARADAAAKAEKLLRTTDPRIRQQSQELKDELAKAQPAPRRPLTEHEVQEADDRYFERMNGWTTPDR